MLHGYFTFRHLLRQKANSVLHLAGLTSGITVCLLIGLFIDHQSSFDSYHDHASRIYRVNSIYTDGEIKFDLFASPVVLSDAIRNHVTGVERVTLARAIARSVVEISPQKLFVEERALIVDPDFPAIFKVQVLRGNVLTALRTPYQAMLTESTAKKYFGSEDPLGKTFKLRNKFVITVAGIIADFPKTTSLPASMLLSFVDNREFLDNGDNWYFGNDEWSSVQASTFVLLSIDHGTKEVETQLNKIADRNINQSGSVKGIHARFELQSLREIHFDSRFGGGPWVKDIRRSWLWYFAFIGSIVLGLACMNFINLSTATALARAKEVGIRKTIGAGKTQLIAQFLSESFALVFASLFLSLALCYLGLGFINSLFDQELSMRALLSPQIIMLIISGSLITTLLAGLYPSWFMSSFNPVTALKAKLSDGSSMIRRTFVIVQFLISTVMIFAVLIMTRQAGHMHDLNLGFDRDHVVTIPLTDTKKAPVFAHDLLTISGVRDVCLSHRPPISNSHWWNNISTLSGNRAQGVCVIFADERFYSFYGIRLISGRIPQPSEFIADSLQSQSNVKKVVVNEKLLAALNLGSAEEAIDKQFTWGGPTEIAGVVADFNAAPLTTGVFPILITLDPNLYEVANVKIEKGNTISETLSKVEKVFKKNFPEDVFEPQLLSDKIIGFYRQEDHVYTLFTISCLLATFISCLGLWGLIAFAQRQRTKEFGIRKILGASAKNIGVLLITDFVVIMGIALVLASPIAYFLSRELLSHFAYRIEITWDLFAMTAVSLAGVMTLTVGFQVFKSANENPVNALKND